MLTVRQHWSRKQTRPRRARFQSHLLCLASWFFWLLFLLYFAFLHTVTHLQEKINSKEKRIILIPCFSPGLNVLFAGLGVRKGHHREGCIATKRWKLRERAHLQSLDSIYLQRQATGDLLLPIRSSLFKTVLFLIMFVCMCTVDTKFFESHDQDFTGLFISAQF